MLSGNVARTSEGVGYGVLLPSWIAVPGVASGNGVSWSQRPALLCSVIVFSIHSVKAVRMTSRFVS